MLPSFTPPPHCLRAPSPGNLGSQKFLLLSAFHSGFLWATLWGTHLAHLFGGVPAYGSKSQEIPFPPPFNRCGAICPSLCDCPCLLLCTEA